MILSFQKTYEASCMIKQNVKGHEQRDKINPIKMNKGIQRAEEYYWTPGMG